MIFFTSDEHFGHKNIIKYCDRPFADVNEMNEAIIRNFNSVVSMDDLTFHLGDVSFYKDVTQFISRLNGLHILIRGNHDSNKAEGIFTAVYDTFFLKKAGYQKIFLSHYSHRVWPESHKGALHLYGHSHGTLPGFGRSMDVGVDTNNFFPYSIDEVVSKLGSIDISVVDHHLSAFGHCR